MIYGSIAWEPLGWRPAWFAEIEPFPSAVLAYRWPQVANMGDMCKLPALIDLGVVSAPDVLVGGTPCQAFSVAGMRKGLADDRGQLTIKYVEVANAIDRKRPEGDECIVVWENVPGVLSDKTNAFGCFLAALVGEDDPLEPTGKKWSNAGIVYGPQRVAAWRILDAQYFGVAQRRRRVFVVASARDGFDPAKVLFEFEGVRRDTPPSREEGEEVTPTIRSGSPNGGAGHGARSGDSKDELIVPVPYSTSGAGYWRDGVGALAANAGMKQQNYVAEPLTLAIRGRDGTPQLESRQDGTANAILTPNGGRGGIGVGAIAYGMTVRRLTPVECERLQGFPDGHTALPWRKKAAEDCPDGPRYKAIGNSKAVPVIKWLGQRIALEASQC